MVAQVSPTHQVALVIEKLSPGCQLGRFRIQPHAASEVIPSRASATRSAIATPLDPPWKHALDSAGVRPCWRASSERIAGVCGATGGISAGRYGRHCAYATLVLNDRFLPYAYALERSLLAAGSQAPLVLLCGPDVSDRALAMLTELCGGKTSRLRVRRVQPQVYPSRYKVSASLNNETRKSLRFTKLEVWRLTTYKKVVLIDTDTMVLKSIDALFTCPAGSAVADLGAPGNFNSGERVTP